MPQTVRPEGYHPRIVDAQIERYLKIFGAVEIAGTKWCGKTWSAREHAQSISYVDTYSNIQAAEADPSLMLLGDNPHVIDEWQAVPAIWDEVRHAVDENSGQKGRWILTGSSTPLTSLPFHSGSGRIGRVKMHPMSLAESGLSDASVSLQGLFDGHFSAQSHPLETRDLVDAVCKGGWPETQAMSVADAQTVIQEYIRLTVEQSFATHGRNPDVARRLLRSLARNVGQSQTYRTLARDMFASADEEDTSVDDFISMRTLAEYLDLYESMFVIDSIPGWVPATRSPKRLRTKPKRYFADPSIAAAVLGMNSDSLLNDWQTFGLLFENLVIRDLLVYAQALPQASDTPVRYYHDDSGLEADAIIELSDGRWAGFEVKVSENKADQGASSLLRLADKVSSQAHAQTRVPEFLAVIVGIGSYAYQRSDGVYVIPISTLGA